MNNTKYHGIYLLIVTLVGISIACSITVLCYRKCIKNNTPTESAMPVSFDLQHQLDNHKFVLVDFYANWCSACQTAMPIVKEVAQTPIFQEKITFISVDVDEHSHLAMAYNIEYLPTFIFFTEGQPVEQITGSLTKEQLLSKIYEVFKLQA